MLVFLDVITNPSTYLFVPFFRIPVRLTKELTPDWQHTFSEKTRKVTWLWINFWNSKDNYKMRFYVWNLIANLREAIQSQKKPLLNCSLPMLDFQVFSRIFLIIFRFHEIFWQFHEILWLFFLIFPDKKKSKMIRRVRKTFKNSVRGVTLEDYLNFYQVCIFEDQVLFFNFSENSNFINMI